MKNKFTHLFNLSKSLRNNCPKFNVVVAKLLTAITVDTRVDLEYAIRKSDDTYCLLVIDKDNPNISSQVLELETPSVAVFHLLDFIDYIYNYYKTHGLLSDIELEPVDQILYSSLNSCYHSIDLTSVDGIEDAKELRLRVNQKNIELNAFRKLATLHGTKQGSNMDCVLALSTTLMDYFVFGNTGQEFLANSNVTPENFKDKQTNILKIAKAINYLHLHNFSLLSKYSTRNSRYDNISSYLTGLYNNKFSQDEFSSVELVPDDTVKTIYGSEDREM